MKWLLLAVLLSSPELVKDINTNPEAGRRGSGASDYLVLDGHVWYLRVFAVERIRLADGKVERVGTARSIGAAGDTPLFLQLNREIYELARTDGTLLHRFEENYSVDFIGRVNGRALIAAYDGKTTRLYSTDGLTVRSFDHTALPLASQFVTSAAAGDFFFILGANGIYRTDGITVERVLDVGRLDVRSLAWSNGRLFAGARSGLYVAGNFGLTRVGAQDRNCSVEELRPVARGVVFTCADQLWTSDGTTDRVLTRDPVFLGPSDGNFAWYQRKKEDDVWRTDGTAIDRIDGIDRGWVTGGYAFDGRLVFTAAGTSGAEPHITEGTSARLLANLAPETNGDAFPRELVPCGEAICFTAEGDRPGVRTVWRSDGTPEGTYELVAEEGVQLRTNGRWAIFTTLRAYWQTDGTRAGTKVVATDSYNTRITHLPGERLVYRRGGVTTLVDLATGETKTVPEWWDGKYYQLGPHLIGAGVNAIWSIDPETGKPRTLIGNSWALPIVVDGVLWFTTYDGVWRTAGTAESLERVLALPPGPGGDTPVRLHAAGSRVFILDYEQNRLRLPDGPWIETSGDVELSSAGDRLVAFTIRDGMYELWGSDGAEAGTRTLLRSGYGQFVGTVGELSLFVQEEAGLWATDGTPEGTRMVADLTPHEVVSSGRRLYLAASRNDVGHELWSSRFEQPLVTAHNTTVVEDAGMARVAVTLDVPSYRRVSVGYEVIGGLAEADDFTALSGTVTFEPGETEKFVDVPIAADDRVEGTETLVIVLRDENGVDVIQRRAVVHIVEPSRRVDLELRFAGFRNGSPRLDIFNHGPNAAAAIRTLDDGYACSSPFSVLPGGSREQVSCRRSDALTVQVMSGESDADPSNDALRFAIAPVEDFAIALSGQQLVAGRTATLTVATALRSEAVRFTLTSSDRQILALPSVVEIPAGVSTVSLPVEVRGAGKVTIAATPAGFSGGRVELTVEAIVQPDRRRAAGRSRP
ncbi:MAG TPA: Calx-beta domain-containing protein [Thermoanaerobaculia bacterium]